MLKKLALDQTKMYERHLALEEISKMLVSFVKGLPHHLAIGAEQGDIEKWDDLVIQTNTGGYIHVQVKRQTTDFSTYSIKRDTYVQGKNKGVLRDLSPFDETLRSLGERISKKESNSSNSQKEFWLVLPESSIEIKKRLEIRHLRKFCEVQIKSVTTSNNLHALAKIDPNAQNIYEWLTTWCDFKDWEHILKALNVLKIKTPGMETDIVDRVDQNLSQIFVENEIKKVRMLILSYLEENTTYAGAIKPRQLLHELKDSLHVSISRWTKFQTDGSNWNISGIHDLENNNEIERSSVIVPALWPSDNPNARSLKIEGSYLDGCPVSNSLMRLSLHPQGSFDIVCSNESSWKQSIKNITGGTLGVAKNDLNELRILARSEPSSSSEARELNTIDSQEEYAEDLHYEMYKTTFKLVDGVIFYEIRKMEKGDLRIKVGSRWKSWKLSLENSVEEQRKLFTKILHPNAEGKSISGELRVGPKTVDLLSEALFLLLVVSVCLGDEDNSNWESVTNKLEMNSVGLAYWSGPADGTKKVIEIDDEVGFSKLLEKERGQIIIIPQSKLSDLEAFNDDIAGGNTKLTLLTHPRYPKLLITKDRKFKNELKKGDISKLIEYFRNSLDKYQSVIINAVDEVVS